MLSVTASTPWQRTAAPMRVSCVSWRVTVKCSTVCAFDGASVGGSCALFCDEVAEVCALVLALAAFAAGWVALVACVVASVR